ncbi:hypothetical protein ACHAXR_006610 [Thalassiosira sp. AJA248-18]
MFHFQTSNETYELEKEINDHESRGHWSIVHRDTLPKTAKLIKAIWSIKRKRAPDGSLLKHKARMCAHGGMQQWGDSYWETYSPVINMLSVRLILAIAKIHNLDSKAIDFVLAFPQADLEEDIWIMNLPIGFQGDIGKFLDIEITQLDDNRFKISQPYLIDRIVSLLKLNQDDLGFRTNPKATPVGKPVLNKDLEDKPRKEDWNYRTAVGGM